MSSSAFRIVPTLLRANPCRNDEQLVRLPRDALRHVLEMHEPRLLVEPLHVGLKIWHRLTLLDHRKVDAEGFALKEPEHFVADDLQVLGGMEGRVERDALPREFATQREQPVADRRVMDGHGSQDEPARGALVQREVEVARFVSEDVHTSHRETILGRAGKFLPGCYWTWVQVSGLSLSLLS
jgi:hypothetical protein